MTMTLHSVDLVKSWLDGKFLYVEMNIDGKLQREQFDSLAVANDADGGPKVLEYMNKKYCLCGQATFLNIPPELKVHPLSLPVWQRLKTAFRILRGRP